MSWFNKDALKTSFRCMTKQLQMRKYMTKTRFTKSLITKVATILFTADNTLTYVCSEISATKLK